MPPGIMTAVIIIGARRDIPTGEVPITGIISTDHTSVRCDTTEMNTMNGIDTITGTLVVIK
jgi:hypothetical protein